MSSSDNLQGIYLQISLKFFRRNLKTIYNIGIWHSYIIILCYILAYINPMSLFRSRLSRIYCFLDTKLKAVSRNSPMCTLHRIGVSGHRRLEHNNITTNKLSGFSIDSLINSKWFSIFVTNFISSLTLVTKNFCLHIRPRTLTYERRKGPNKNIFIS